MFSKRQLIIMYCLLVAGLIVAIKLLHIDYMVNYSSSAYKSFCNINSTFNCDAVASSKYSFIFGIPVALIGTIANLFLIIFLPIGMRLPNLKSEMRTLYQIIFALYSVGCVYLATISTLYLSSFCILCMFYWGISIITFIYLCWINRGVTTKNLISLFQGFGSHYSVIIIGLLLFAGSLSAISYSFFPKECIHKEENRCEHYDKLNQTAFLGQEYAKLEIIMYTDFECPWCKRVHALVAKLAEKYERQVRFVRKEFPLDMKCNRLLTTPMHQWACLAAYYAKCAGKQGKFWAFHNEVYSNQSILSEQTLTNIAKLLSLNLDELNKCVNSNEVKEAVKADIEEGLRYNISGTPVFRIGDKIFEGALTEEQINQFLNKGNKR